jgi:predicted CoA-binding protein
MTTQKTIDDFFAQPNFAIAGVSRNSKKFGNIIYRALKKKGTNVFAVNPNTDSIDGDKCYRTINDLPAETKALIIFTPPAQTASILKDAHEKGIKHIWIQQKCESKEALVFADKMDPVPIYGYCFFMFMKPFTFPHNMHRFFFKMSKQFPC